MNKVRWLIPAVLCSTSLVLAGPSDMGKAGFSKGMTPYKSMPCQNGSGSNCGASLNAIVTSCGGCHLVIHTILLRGTNPPLTVWLNQSAWNALPIEGQVILKDGFLYVGNAKFPVEYHNAAGERVDFSGSINIMRSPKLPAAKYQLKWR